jgi:hypothetical protein
MAIGAATIYPEFGLRVLRQQLDYLNGSMKAALLLNTYVPDLENDKVWDDISAHEIEDEDYTPLTLASKTIALDGSLRPVISHANLDFGSDVDITAKYLVRYSDGATKYLMSYTDLNVGAGNLVVSGGPLVISVPANGVARLTLNA